MTHVVAEPCVLCKHTDCVEVCPVDAFREGENCLVIDPTECIDCTLCVAVCPERAIFIESELPPRWSEWLELNERLARDWPMLRRKLSPMPGHNEARSMADRRSKLSERAGSGRT